MPPSKSKSKPKKTKTKRKLKDVAVLARGIPPKMFIRLKYNEVIQPANAGVGTAVLYKFRPNSMYDVNETDVGHQFMWRDSLLGSVGGVTGLYHRYLCNKYTYSITVTSNKNKDTRFVVTNTVAGDSEANSDDISALIEGSPNKQSTMIPSSSHGGGRVQKTLRGSIKIKELEGVSYLSPYEYGAEAGQNPNRTPNLNIYLKPVDGSSVSTGDYTIEATIYGYFQLWHVICPDTTN